LEKTKSHISPKEILFYFLHKSKTKALEEQASSLKISPLMLSTFDTRFKQQKTNDFGVSFSPQKNGTLQQQQQHHHYLQEEIGELRLPSPSST
jgi:hypothetical protein